MAEFTMSEMQEMQRRLQERYRGMWEPIEPETGKNKLLWMIGEIGEVIDIVKKHGDAKACADPELKRALVEEMADVLMYYGTTAQFGGTSDDVFSAICGTQISRFTSSKPSKFAFASDEKSIRQPTTSFVRCCLITT